MNHFDLKTLQAQAPQLRRLARAIVGEANADDIVQEAWAAALDHSGDAPRNWGAWLQRATRNLAWSQRNKARNEHARAVDVFDADQVEHGAADVAARIEEKHLMERAILELEEPYRSALLWRYYEDLSVEEISRRAGTIPSTTRSHLQRGLDRLRARFESEKGAEWRLALVPFLRYPEPATKAALVAGASGLGLLTLHKIIIAAAIAAAFLALHLQRLPDISADDEDLAVLVPPSAEELQAPEATDEPLAEILESDSGPRVAPVEPTSAPAVTPNASKPLESITLQLVDFKSGLPLPGVAFKAHYTVTKRWLFSTGQEDAAKRLTTDEEGRVTFQLANGEEGPIDPNSIHATLDTSPLGLSGGPDRSEPLSVLRTLSDDTVQLSADPAAAFWVRLPDGLTAAEVAALDAQLRGTSPGQVSILGSPFAPLAVRERDLLFQVPRDVAVAGWDRQEKATLHIATTDSGPSFRATIGRDVSLAETPILAERCTEVSLRVRVLADSTDEPVENATVLLRGEGKSNPNAYGIAQTDAEGRARFIGVPQAALSIEVIMEGYDLLTETREITRSEGFDLRLDKGTELRAVRINLRSDLGPGVSSVQLATLDVETHHQFLKQYSVEPRRTGEGWVATVWLEDVPARPIFLELDFTDHAHAPQGPIRIEPYQDTVAIDLGEEMPRRSLFLRLPPDVEVEYRQRIDDGPEYSYRGLFGDGSKVTDVAVDGRPVHWVIDAQGYLPVKGTERDLLEVQHDDKPCMLLEPALVEGSGLLLSAKLWAPPDDVPISLYRSPPLQGVPFTLSATGEVLGTTDESGYLVVARNVPRGTLAATYKGKTQVLSYTGEDSRVSVSFRP